MNPTQKHMQSTQSSLWGQVSNIYYWNADYKIAELIGTVIKDGSNNHAIDIKKLKDMVKLFSVLILLFIHLIYRLEMSSPSSWVLKINQQGRFWSFQSLWLWNPLLPASMEKSSANTNMVYKPRICDGSIDSLAESIKEEYKKEIMALAISLVCILHK